MDIKTRNVIRGTLKTVGRAEINVARGSIKTTKATTSAVRKQIAEPDGSSSESAANRLTGYGRSAATDAAQRVRRVGRRSAIKSVKQIRKARAEAILKQEEAAAAAANKPTAAAGAANAKIKQGGRSIKKASAQAAKGGYNAAAAMRKAVEQKGAKKAARSVFTAVKAAAKAVVTAVKKLFTGVTFALGGGFLVLVIAIVVCICGSVSLLLQSSTETDMTTNAPAVYYYLRTRLGLNSAAACGVMANIEAESNFQTGAIGDGGTSIGLCQWHNGRYERLFNYCYSKGYDPYSLYGQLEYLNYELNTSYSYILSYLYSVSDDIGGCYDAGYYFCVNFERPADSETKGADRGLNAVQTYYWTYAADEGTEQGMALALTAYMELGNDGGAKYWSWYGFSSRVEWCAIFVSWCANQLGYIDAGIMPLSCNIGSEANGYPWYYSHGKSLNATGVIPQAGWVAFFGRGHTGIVYAVQNDTFWLVEGNSNDAVNINQYTLADAPSIMWFCVPPYTH